MSGILENKVVIIAEAAAFLCSDKATYMSGQMMIIDGGMTSAFEK
jgi:NAD(P)-dependent dehydrogenase (short-subunit alcohol dehydrogenase family)